MLNSYLSANLSSRVVSLFSFVPALALLLLITGFFAPGPHAPGSVALAGPQSQNQPPPNCGLAWRVISQHTVGEFISDMAALSSEDIWAVGMASYAERLVTSILHWDGREWRTVPSPNPNVGQNYLRGVAAVSENDIWAVGGTAPGNGPPRTLAVHWDGSSWTEVPSGGIQVLYDVAAVSSNDVWAVGNNEHGQTLTMHWDGRNWTRVSSPNASGSINSLQSVTAVSPNDVWAVGEYCQSDCRGDLKSLVLHWDGTRWSIVPSPNPELARNRLQGVAAVSANDIWAVGYSSFEGQAGEQGGDKSLVMHWDGREWKVVPSPSPYKGVFPVESTHLAAVTAVSANDVWAVGNSPYFTHVIHWDGVAWSVVASPDAGAGYGGDLAAVAAVSSTDVWAVGQAGYHALVERYSDPCAGVPTPGAATRTPPPATVPTVRTTFPPTPIPGNGRRGFPETGKTLRGIFLDYWNDNGGLMQQGYPISELFTELSDHNGQPYTVQYFERSVFEYHPENRAPFNVLLSHLGTARYKMKFPSPKGAPGQHPNMMPGSVQFPQTGKRLGGKFLDYWNKNGGLMQQGYPISNEFMEESDLNGKEYLVQYFERAVFELHPENQPPFDTLLSQLGSLLYRERYSEP